MLRELRIDTCTPAAVIHLTEVADGVGGWVREEDVSTNLDAAFGSAEGTGGQVGTGRRFSGHIRD